MEPIPSTATLIDPATVPSVSPRPTVPAVPERAMAGEPLPRQVFWAGVIVSAVLPAVVLITLFVLVASAKYNFLDWME